MDDIRLASIFRPENQFKAWTNIISIDETAITLEALFQREQALPGVIIEENHQSRTLLSRRVFFAVISRPFGREVFLKRPLRELLASAKPETLILSEDTPLSVACRAALARCDSNRFEPFIMISGASAFIIELADLLLAQADALEKTVFEKSLLAETATQTASDLKQALQEQHQLAEELERARTLAEHDATHDSLTGLLNRKGFFAEMRAAMTAKASGKGPDYGLLFLDLDRFKLINDSLGHHRGNELLIQVAERLSALAARCNSSALQDAFSQDKCIVGRHSGDEFVLLQSIDEDPDAILKTAQTLLASLTAPYMLGGKPYTIGVSIGLVGALSHYEDHEPALRDADIAMYEAKRHKEQPIVRFESPMHKTVERRVELEAELREAVHRNELVLHYQPIIDTFTGAVFAYEGLLRWQRERDIIPPGEFISVAEETGLINEIGLHVMRSACHWMKNHTQKGGNANSLVSLNISAVQLANTELPAQFEAICLNEAVPTSRFILEVTEQSAMSYPERSLNILEDLKQRGFRLALDDFGTGYSSLSWLHKYPFDLLKVDRSLIAGVGQTANSEKMAAGILHLSKILGLHVIAEGVERLSQKQTLNETGFQLMQGYHFGRPAPSWPIEASPF